MKFVLPESDNIDYRDLHVLLSGNPGDFLNETSDIEVVEWLLQNGADIRLVQNLHAKVYIADKHQAIITSANLTSSGLGLSASTNNVEIGILIDQMQAVISLRNTVKDWFSQGYVADQKWLCGLQHYIQLNSSQQTKQKIQEGENELRRSARHVTNKRIIVVPQPDSGSRDEQTSSKIPTSHTTDADPSTDLRAILTKMFDTRQECEAGLQYFYEALTFLPSLDSFKHIISATYRFRENKMTLNIGNWEILCLRLKKAGLKITFCVNFSLLNEEVELQNALRTSRLAEKWSKGGSFGFIEFMWDYQAFQFSNSLQMAWQSAVHHAVQVFGSWKASSYMTHHREDLFLLFTDDNYRNTALEQAF
jgi:hypothetical protein